MAAKKPKNNKGNKNKVIKVSAAEKAARDSINRAMAGSLAQSSARIRAGTRGALGSRKLRASGTGMEAYNAGRFANTFGAAPAAASSPGIGSNSTGTAAPTSTTKPTKEGKARAKAQEKAKKNNERKDNMNSPNVTEARLERERLAKAAAAKRAKEAAAKKAAEALARKKKLNSNSTKKGAGGSTMS